MHFGPFLSQGICLVVAPNQELEIIIHTVSFDLVGCDLDNLRHLSMQIDAMPGYHGLPKTSKRVGPFESIRQRAVKLAYDFLTISDVGPSVVGVVQKVVKAAYSTAREL